MRSFGALGLYSAAHPMIHEKIHTDPFETYLTFKNFLLNLFMMQTIIAPPLGSNQPLWTISLKFWFYVVFGVCIIALWARGAKRSLGLAATLLLCLALGANFVVHMGLWLIGVGVGFVRWPSAERPLLATALLFGLLIFFRFAKSFFVLGDALMLRNYLVALSFAWVLMSMRGVRWKLLEVLGPLNGFFAGFSYSLYLIHFPVMLFALGALHATGFFSGIAQGYSPTDPRGLLAYVLTVVAVGLSAYAFSQITENQTPRLRDMLRRRFG
jgi:peptidoglycan/LPS O-acetylase OafA/YrhL